MTTYTPTQGTTQQGQQQNSMQQLLSTLNPISAPKVTQQQVTQAQAAPLSFAQQIPGKMQQAQQQLTQQSGIPQLQGQQQDMGKMFQLWLADQNLSQKYTNPQLGSGQSPLYSANIQPNQAQYTGQPSQVQNPYLGSPQDIINAVSPTGQGFTSPSAVTSTMQQVPNATSSIMNLLQSAIGTEGGLVQSKLGDVSQNYQTALNTLLGIGNLYQQTYQNQLSLPSSPQNVGALQDQILSRLGGNATPDDVWNYLNSHDADLRAQGIDMNQMWKWQQDLANKAQEGTVGTGKVTTAQAITPMTSTSKGQTSVTGWKIKLRNGQTKVVKRPDVPNIPVITPIQQLLGQAPQDPTQNINPADIYAKGKQKGISDSEIVNDLQTLGFTVQ